MGRLLVRCIAVVVIALIAGTPLAHADDPIAVSIVDADDARFPQVQAIVTVLDATGKPVQGLGPQAFVAEETGAAATVSRVDSVLNQQLGLGVILTIDTSGSMVDGGAIELAKAAASAFVSNLQPVDQVAVVSFANQVQVQDVLSADRTTSQSALGRLFAVGNTALYNAIVESVNLARNAKLPRKAIVLLSDGQDTGNPSTTTREQALSIAADNRIPVYAIGLGPSIDRPFLEDLARRSGGAFLEAPDATAIASLYERISQLLRSQYVLTLESKAAANVADRSLTVTATAPQGSSKARLDYRSRRDIAVAAAPESTQEKSGGGNNVLLALLAVIGVAVLAIGARSLFSRLRERRLASELEARSQRALGELHVEAAPGPLPAGEPSQRASAYLRVEGPEGDRRFPIGSSPATIGASPASQLVLLDGAGGIAPEHARVWSMEGKLIFRQLAKDHPSRVSGKPITLVSLENGDEIEIGPYKLRVELPGT